MALSTPMTDDHIGEIVEASDVLFQMWRAYRGFKILWLAWRDGSIARGELTVGMYRNDEQWHRFSTAALEKHVSFF
jgi:hypothetical protein